MIITLPCSSHHPPVGWHCCLLGRSPGLSFTGERAGNTLNEKKLKQVGEVKSLVMTENRQRWGRGCRGADTLRGSEIRDSRTPLRYMTLGEEKRTFLCVINGSLSDSLEIWKQKLNLLSHYFGLMDHASLNETPSLAPQGAQELFGLHSCQISPLWRKVWGVAGREQNGF